MSQYPTPPMAGQPLTHEVIDERIEARVRPLEESLARFADNTGKAIQGLSDRISNEIRETHAIIRLTSAEAKAEAQKTSDALSAMTRDRGKINYTAIGVVVSIVGLLVAGGQVVGHWLMESRIAPISEQVKSETLARISDSQTLRDSLKQVTDSVVTQLRAEADARKTVSDDLRRLTEREIARNDEFDRRFLDLTKTTERLAGREDAIFDLFKTGLLNLSQEKK